MTTEQTTTPAAPVTGARERMLFLAEFEESPDTYAMTVALRIVAGRVDPPTLTAAVRDVAHRHLSLRTAFRRTGNGWVEDVRRAAEVPVEDRSDRPWDGGLPFAIDPSRDLPLAAAVFTEHVVLVIHHVAADGESAPVILADLERAYAARATGRAPAWEAEATPYLDPPTGPADALARRFAQTPAITPLPNDRPRRASPSSAGVVLKRRLPASLAQALTATATRTRSTRLMLFQGAVALALRAHGGGDRIALGMPADQRTEADARVGLYLNTVAIPLDLSGRATVSELTGRVRDATLDALEERDVPFDALVTAVDPPRHPGVHPIFQVMVAEVDRRVRRVRLGEVAAVVDRKATPTAKFDLTFAIGDDDDENVVIDVVYRDELFDPATAEGLLDSVTLALAALTGPPEAIADETTLIRSARERPVVASAEPPGPTTSSRRIDAPADQVAAALVAAYAAHDALGTRREGDRYVPSTLEEILDAARVTAEPRTPDPAAGRPVAATVVDDGVQLTAATEVVDDESWPALLATVSAGTAPVTGDVATHAEQRMGRAEDLGIIDAAEAWLDTLDEVLDLEAHAQTDLSDGSGCAQSPLAPPTVVALREAVVGALAAQVSGPLLIMVSEPDRDDADAGAVGARRRSFPVLVRADGTHTHPDEQAARDFQIARSLSEHTPGVFDDWPEPDLHLDLHVSDLPATHRPGRLVVTLSPSGDGWQVTVSGHPRAAALAESLAGALARHHGDDAVPSVLASIVRPEAAPVHDVAGIGVAAIRGIERVTGPLRMVYPTTSLQDGLLFHRELSGDTEVYLSQTITELTGTLDIGALQAAAARVVDLHPHIAGHFRAVGERRVLVVPRDVSIPWEVAVGDDAEAFVAGQRREFDDDGPLLRFGVLTSTDGRHHTWVLTVEHAMLDGWSLSRLLNLVLEEYTRHGTAAESVGAPYTAYAAWLVGRDADAARRAWADALADISEPTLVARGTDPRDRLEPGAEDRSVEQIIALEPALTERLRGVAKGARTTLSAVYELAWALALRYETGSDDVVFGSVTSGRPAEIPGIDGLLGLLFNTVPVRVRLDPGSDVARHLDTLAAYRRVMLAHPYVPLSELLAASGHRELFDTLFVFQNIPVAPADERLGPDGALRQQGRTVRDATHYPLTVVINPGRTDSDARIRVMWRPAAWSETEHGPATVERLLTAFQKALVLLGTSTRPLAALDLRTDAEQESGELVGAAVRDADVPVLDETVWELLERRARLDPDAVAVVAGSTRWTFAELRRRAGGLGAALQEAGVGPESKVALYLPRDERTIASLFAVFAAHAGYVPIDPTLPAHRVAEILAAADPDVVVADPSLAANLPPGHRVISPDAVGDGPLTEPVRHLDALAYVIFTSGSTGRPKGVAVGYRGLTNMFVNHRAEIFDPVVATSGGRRLAIAHTTSFAFDASWEQLLWLLEGHSVHVIDDDLRRDPRALLEYYDEHRIDGFDVTPSYAEVLLDEGLLRRPRCTDPTADGPGVTFVSLGGEAVPDGLWSALRDAPGVGSYNLYGPTEYTINALGADLSERETSTVGRPVTGTVARILDRGLQPVRPGVVGELYLSGVGLARGYLGRSDLTAERFVADPHGPPGARMYRTGDLAALGADGLISYRGRGDDQVKIRGYRVEPAEVASAVAEVEGVQRAAVVPIRGAAATELAAYVVPADGADPDAASVRQELRERLPDYLVPSTITFVDTLPLNVNGKLDLRALPAPAREAVEKEQPVGDVEYLIAEAFGAVLGIETVGRDDDFFVLGGHSLLAVRVMSRLRAAAGLDLNVRDLYAAPTVAELARAAAGDRDGSMFEPVLRLREADGPAVFCLQPAGGLGWAYAGLSRHLDPGFAIYALQDPALSGGPELESVEAIVADQIARIRSIRPNGPYHLLGWSFGGQLAHAIAAELGGQVASVVLLDAYADGGDDQAAPPVDDVVDRFVAGIAEDPVLGDLDPDAQARLVATFERHYRLSIPPALGKIPIDALLVAATVGISESTAARRDAAWRERVEGELRVEPVDLDHGGLGRAANWDVFGPTVAAWIESAAR